MASLAGGCTRRPRASSGPRRSFTLGLVLALGLLCPLGCRSESTPPNIVIYLVDTLRRDHLGLYGYDRETSPRLDKFAEDAVVYEDARTPASWTRPATASLLTGLNPHRHGAITRMDTVLPETQLLGHYLRPAGYHAAAFVTNPNVLPVWGFARGFDHFYDIESVARSTRADRVNEVVFEHMTKHIREPFFLYVHTLDPHSPYEPPPPFDRAWPVGPSVPKVEVDRAAYDGEIAFNDLHFGALLDRLQSEGLYDGTLIVFTSDHGEEFGEHGAVGHGRTLFDEQLRVPLVIKFPNGAGAGSRVEQRVSLVDIVPTILKAVGVAVPDDLEGVQLPAVSDGAQNTERSLFFDLNLDKHVSEGILLGRYKLVRTTRPFASTRLFHLARDPGEKRNAITAKAAVGSKLSELLDDYVAQHDSGVHLWLVSPGEQVPRVCKGRISVVGTFEQVRASQIESGDIVRLNDARDTLSIRVELQDRPNPVRLPPFLIVDIDKITFRVDPRDAPVRILRLACDGAPFPVFLGSNQLRLASVPLTIPHTSADARISRMGALFRGDRKRSTIAEGGAYIGVLHPRPKEDVRLEPEVEERLRALGYVP